MQKRIKHITTTETGKHSLIKFAYVVLIFIAYALFVINKYGTDKGIAIAALTWSFFVFCTPIADAGFLLAFPIRITTGIRMIYTQIIAYVIAAFIVVFLLVSNPSIFNTTILLRLFKIIITNPVPYWIIIILSGMGTFLSIYFGDELMDVATHKEREKFHKHGEKHRFIITLTVILLTIAAYKMLLDTMGIDIPLV